MKIAFITLNANFCGPILEELRSHHTVRFYRHRGDPNLDYHNLVGLLNWCDLAYFDFIQKPLPWTSQQQWIDKPIVARMDGIDILHHHTVDWRKVSALIIQPVQERRLQRLRRLLATALPDKKLPALPSKILRCYLGIDLTTFEPDNREPTYHIALHSSWMRPTKQIYTAIQTFYELLRKDKDTPWKFTIIGQWEGGYRWPERMEYVLACRELIDVLRFPEKRLFLKEGDFPRKMWASFTKTIDIYWCLSFRESFGVSMAEAAASGAWPIINWFLGAELIYPEEHLCKTPGEIIEKTMAWGKLAKEEKLEYRRKIRTHTEQWDQRKTAKRIRELCEEVLSEKSR